MPVETATPLRRPTRSPPFLRSKLSDGNCCVLVRTNVLNNTNYAGGMYSHAKHIWMIGIFYFLVSFYNIGTRLWKLALERRFLGDGKLGRTCRYSLGRGIIGGTRTPTNGVNKQLF